VPSIHGKLVGIQRELKAPKNQHNGFGNYDYRSKEDILEAVKPLAHDRSCTVVCDDRVMCMDNGWAYVITKATLYDSETGDSVYATGLAREQESRKGMDASQITGTASSYAGKRALGNLFAIDDTKDADTPLYESQTMPSGQFDAHCRSCGTTATWPAGTTIEQLNGYSCCPNPDWAL